MPSSNEQFVNLACAEREAVTKHDDCGTKECCGGCDEKQVDLADANLEQTSEAAIDLMVSILGLQQEMGRHIEVFNLVCEQLDTLGMSDEDVPKLTLTALRRFGIPEENIAAVFAEMEAMFGDSDTAPVDSMTVAASPILN